MKQNPEFVMGDVAGNHSLMPIGRATLSLNGMITLNDIGVCIWEMLSEDTSYSALLHRITSRFDVEEDTADADLKAFLDVLRKANAIVE